MRGLLIIVNYNQALEVAPFLKRVAQFHAVEDCVFVDDGSTDTSPMIAEAMGYRVSRHAQNLGIGAAIRTGIATAIASGAFEYAIIMSSNGKMRPEEIATVTAPIRAGVADYVQGNRFVADGRHIGLPLFRRLALPLFNLIAGALLGKRVSDISCGFRAYRLVIPSDRRVNLDQAWLNRYELEFYLHHAACRFGYRIAEVPVTIDYSHLARGRRSKIRPFVDWWRMLRPFLFLRLGIAR